MAWPAVRCAAALTLSLLAGGCSAWRVGAPPAATASAAEAPLAVDMRGRFSMRYTSTQGPGREEYVSGTFRLQHDAQRSTLELVSPFGQTMARAGQSAGEAAMLQTADGRQFSGPDLDSVFQQALGMKIPASRLPHWLSGHFERILARSDAPPMVRAVDSGWSIDRRDRRWDLQRVQPDERIEVRLIADPE